MKKLKTQAKSWKNSSQNSKKKLKNRQLQLSWIGGKSSKKKAWTYMGVFGWGFVTGKLPQYFTKPDIWHLGLKLNVSRSFSATVTFNPRVVCMHFGRKKLLWKDVCET